VVVRNTKKKRLKHWILGGAVVALLCGSVLAFMARPVLSRLMRDDRAGVLEQTIVLFVERATQAPRRSLARVLGLLPTPEGVEDSAARAALPEFQVIAAVSQAELTPAADLSKDYSLWSHSFGDATAAKYSSLDQINRKTVKLLARAWTYEGKGAENIQATPVFTGREIVFPDTSDQIVAVDPANGKVIWRFDPKTKFPARRGLAFVPSGKDGEGTLFFTASGRLFAIRARDGVPVESFNRGSVSIGYESRVAPIVAGDVLVVASFKPALHIYDLKTGALIRQIDYLSAFDERGWLARLLGGTPDYGGANPWGGMALDEARRIAFLSTSNPTPVGVGVDRVGSNRPTASVVAISIDTGKILWVFQEIAHDLWDLDIASPPVLAQISHEGKRVDVVVAATKSGNLLLLDRLTGKPVFDFRLRRAPTSTVPGERTSPYQPDPVLPEPFGRSAFTMADVTDIGNKNRAAVLAQLDGSSTGFYPPHKPDVPTVFFGLHGGAMHYGTSLDPTRGMVYVAASQVPSMFTITSASANKRMEVQGPGAAPYRAHCAGCHGAKLEGGGDIPPLAGLAKGFDNSSFRAVVRNGVRTMPPIERITDQEIGAIRAMLTSGDDEIAAGGIEPKVDSRPGIGYRRTAYLKLRDNEGYPGSKPPWGTLTAIDLNTGRRVWQVTLGRYDELIARGIPQTGTENISGPMATAGGLVFASGTKDRLIRAFESDTGKELWEAQLPFIGTASPMTYVFKGSQYVLIAATGGGTLELYDDSVKTGNSFVAFRLNQ
jgi:quinoprotein glucose dehydrogenase